MGEFLRSIDTILWGRKTYDKALELGGEIASYGANIRHYVFTRRPPGDPVPGVEFVDEPIGSFAKRLRSAPGKNIWMMGGGELIGAFLDDGEIDEFSIFVMPTIIGEGIPLVAPRHRLVPLELVASDPYDDGVVRLHYAVGR